MVLCDMGTEVCFLPCVSWRSTSALPLISPAPTPSTVSSPRIRRPSTILFLVCLLPSLEWLEMNRSCQKMLRPGVNWTDVHLNANRVGLEGLKKMGIVKYEFLLPLHG